MNHRRLIGLLALITLIIAIVIVLVNIPAIYGRLTAPRLNGVVYTHTRYTKPTMCFIICKNEPSYQYDGTGSQKIMAEGIILSLKKQGYELKNFDNPDNTIACYGNSGDDYYFSTSDGAKQLVISFYADTQLPDVDTSDIGCQRPDAHYRIELIRL